MLRTDERAAVRDLIVRATIEIPATPVDSHRIWHAREALEVAYRAYCAEASRGLDARLDCFTTMVRAGAGALRERLGEARRG